MSRIMNIANNKSTILCFVCDQKVCGEKVNLATSIATQSKVTLPEKISQLIGDDFVVAVTEQDCVCKRCASLLNHMDKLENELTLVKRALITNISQKYKINFGDIPAAPPQPAMANGGLKTDSASDYEDEGRKVNPDLNMSNPTLVKKKPIPTPTKVVSTPKPVKPQENVTKLKIYKCGFCSYQSKELGNVRLHMKIHIRANKPEGDGDKTGTLSSPLLATKNPMSVRRRVFRCQVCSASFDDRNKCLEHISRDHTAAGRKMVEQKQSQEQSQINKVPEQLTDGAEHNASVQPEQPVENAESQQKENYDESGSQEEMDTTDPPSIALYSCDTCSSTFDNDVDFANHVNEHVKCDGTNTEPKTADVEGNESAKGQTFTQISSQTDNPGANDDETPKDSNMSLDIEAMIAALHSEGPETASDSMPNI